MLVSIASSNCKHSDFWHSDLRDNCESVCDDVFHLTVLTCVMSIPGESFKTSYILAINKTVKQRNPKFENFQHQLNTLNHENTTKCAQNVHREPSDTSRETATPLTDGCNNNRMVQLSPFS